MRHAELARQRLARRIEVDADDHVGAGHPRALHHVEADAAQAEHHDIGAGLDLRRVDDGADARGDAAADVADLVERRVLADFRERDLGQHGEVGERRAAHVVVQRLAAQREAAGAVGHQPLALRRADRRAQVGLARQARLALPALGRVERNDVVALARRVVTPGPTSTTMPAPSWPRIAGKESFGIGAGAREFVGMADAGGLDLDQHLARPWARRAAPSRSSAARPLRVPPLLSHPCESLRRPVEPPFCPTLRGEW